MPSVFFKTRGNVTDIQTFEVGSGICELPRLRKLYGRVRWRKQKGVADIELPNGRFEERNFGARHNVYMGLSRGVFGDDRISTAFRDVLFRASNELRRRSRICCQLD